MGYYFMKHSIFIKTIFLLVGVFILFTSKAQPMNTIDILQNLKPFSIYLDELKKEEFLSLQEEKEFDHLEKSISSEYNFITLELYCITRVSDSNRKKFEQRLLCKLRFEIVNDKILFKELYHEDPLRKAALALAIPANKKITEISWQTKVEDKSFYNEKLKYLTAADEIASLAMNCTRGDDYRPGFYSEVEVNEEYIKLSQTNHMNAKSLDHKKDYSLRKLEFKIPLTDQESPKSLFNSYHIGAMQIYFSDNSSENNKSCGDKIEKKIEEITTNWKE
jgi:hypothetical protein